MILTALPVVGLEALGAGPLARAQVGGVTSAQLEIWASELASEDARKREEAIQHLLALDEESVPTIADRIESFPQLNANRAYDSLNSFRHAVGSRNAEDDVDVLPGVIKVLEDDRSRTTVAMAERRILVRALADIGSVEAGRAMANLFATDATTWRWEAKRAVFRMGERALPILIEARGHDDRAIRRWARWGVKHLGLLEPGRAVQTEDVGVLADTLRAYGKVRDMDAMPVVVSFVTSDRSRIRNAARWSIEQFAGNAVWQLRRTYRNVVGETANLNWDWRETATELYRAFDQQRLAPMREDIDEGLEALEAGEIDVMLARFEGALRRAPDLPESERLAPGFAAAAATAAREGDRERAQELYEQAIRLAPSSAGIEQIRAELLYLEAEELREAGFFDQRAFEQVLVWSPEHEGAALALESPEHGVTDSRFRRGIFGGLALLLLLAAAGLFLRGRGQTPEATPAADLTSDTLPG